MAIAFDAASGEVSSGATNTTLTGQAITIGVGNPILFVYIGSTNALTSLTCTYNGVSMTLIDSNTTGTATFHYNFALLNPTTGSAISPIGTWASAAGFKDIVAVSYTGVGAIPTNKLDSNGTGTSFNTTLAVDSTPNSWVILSPRNEGGTLVAGTGTTIRSTVAPIPNSSPWCDSNGVVTASANYSMAASFPSAVWRNTMFQLTPVTSSTAASFLLKLL